MCKLKLEVTNMKFSYPLLIMMLLFTTFCSKSEKMKSLKPFVICERGQVCKIILEPDTLGYVTINSIKIHMREQFCFVNKLSAKGAEFHIPHADILIEDDVPLDTLGSIIYHRVEVPANKSSNPYRISKQANTTTEPIGYNLVFNILDKAKANPDTVFVPYAPEIIVEPGP